MLGSSFTTHPIEATYDLFEAWLEQYDIDYVDANNKIERYNIWKDNVESINDHNSGNHKWTQGINQFTGLTFDEFSDLHLMEPQDCSATAHHSKSNPALNPNHRLLAADPTENLVI